MPGILTYFLLAVFFLAVCILAVPSEDTKKEEAPLAIGPALLIPKAEEKGPTRP